MLNKRQKSIINLLNDLDSWQKGKQLAILFSVSDRTIRHDIEKINTFYRCPLILSNHQKGYFLNKKYLIQNSIETQEVIPQTSHERCIWIIKELLFGKNDINLISLQDSVYVSEFSIDNDLKKVRKMIMQYPSLKLIRYQNHVRLEGNEADKRLLYKELLNEEIQGNFLNLSILASLWKRFDLIKIKDIFENICQKYNYTLLESYYNTMIIHTGIVIDRILDRKYISSNDEIISHDTKAYHLSYEFFSELKDYLDIPMVQSEIEFFASQLYGNFEKPKDFDNSFIMKMVEKMILKMSETFGIDFNDEELKINLCAHINCLLYREDNHIEIENLYLKDIKKRYPLIFEIAVFGGKIIEEDIGHPLQENELAFFALHLGGAYERINENKKYRVVLFIPNNHLLSQAFVHKIKQKFYERIDIVKVVKFFDEKEIEAYHPHFLISTIQIEHQLNIPTLNLSLFFNFEDESRLFQLLNWLDKEKYHQEFVSHMHRLIRKELFYKDIDMNCKEDVIDYLCDNLEKYGYVSSNYKQSVFEREKISSTSFAYGFSVPHSVNVFPHESTISIMILKHPIKWGEYEVRLILLLSLRENDQPLLNTFFDWLCNVVSEPQLFSQILNISSYEDFMKSILEDQNA